MGLLRLLLAISVVIAHSAPIFGLKMVGGQIAVQAFYMISGFYMTLVLTEKYPSGKGSYRLFLSNRLLRLFPIYWVVLILTALLSIGLGIQSNGSFWLKFQPYINHYDSLSAFQLTVLSLSNIFLLGQDWLMFFGLNVTNGMFFFTPNFWDTDPQIYQFFLVPQAWTIGVEITFYLIAPFLVRRNRWVVVAVILLSFLIRILLASQGMKDDPWSYRFFPNELMFFMLGTVAYWGYKRIEKLDISPRLLFIPLLIVIVNTLFLEQVHFPYKSVCYLAVFFLALPFIFLFSRRRRFDQEIGELSYPVYMCHMLFVMVAGKFSFLTNIVGNGLFVTIAAIGFSIILKKFIADPVEKLRQRRVRQSLVTV